MSGPWEDYAPSAAPAQDGPWNDYQPQQSKGGGDLSNLILGKRPAPSRMEKIGHGMIDPINGGAQLLTHMLPDSVVNAGNQLNNWLADKTGLVARLPEGGVDQQVRQDEAAYQARRAGAGETGIDGYRLLGNVASPANLAIAARAPAVAGLAGKMIVGALSGGATAALSPVAQGDFWSEKRKQAAVGVATGGLTPAVVGGLARVISPNASRNPNLQLLKDEGVQPTIGQALGGAANKIEERMQSVPIMGDMISHARSNASSQFQAAAFNRALKPIGQSLPEGVAGRDAVAFTENTLKQSYDDVLNRIGAIAPDQAFTSKVANLQQMVGRLMMPKAEKQKFASALADVRASIDQNGMMTSDAYKALESSLGADARRLAASQNIYEGKMAPAVKQLQGELRDLLQRQAGQNADDLSAVNAGWANFKRVQNAAAKIGAEDGQFTPAQFQNAVRALDKSKDKGAFSRGSALGQDLGDAGKTVLGSKVPNSGTPERMWMNAGALGSGLVSPSIPVGLLGGAGMYLSPAQRALVWAATSRGQLAQPAAQTVRQTAPFLIPGAVGLGLQVAE
jgi:hypothetical protein